MGFSQFKKVLAGMSAAAITLTQVGTALAAYSDVPSGVWYEAAVEAFVDAGYLDATQSRFRGGDFANRAEFVKLVVELNGGILSTPPAVPSFDDVSTGAWYYGYMEEAGKEGWVRGDGDCYGDHPCYARPGANINRAEAAALIVRAFGLEATDDAAQFVDNPSGQWYTDSIQAAADHCVLQGDDSTGRVRPGDNMNRAEMVVMLYRVDQGLTYGVDCGGDVSNEPMIKDVVGTSSTVVEVEFNVALDKASAEDTGIYTVTGPSGEIAVSSAELLGTDTVELTLGDSMVASADYTLAVKDIKTAGGDMFSDSMDFTGYTEFVQGDGILELSLAASNPAGDTIPKGAIGVVMLSTDFTASCDDTVIIENLTVLHEGFGAVTDISGVYAAVNGARVTRKRTIDAEDQTSDLRFSSPLILDPCETVTVDVVADFSSTASTASEHNLVVELPSDVFSNAKSVTGNFPLRGKSFRMAAVTSGIVTIEYRSVSPTEVEIGDTGVVVGKFEVATDSVEDQTLYSATLEQNSSAGDGDITNIAIRRTDGTVLTNTVAQSVGDFVTLVFDPPFTVLEGDKITLEVIGDIVGGAGDSVQMNFEEASDLFAVGSLYGYGVNGQLYGSQVAIDNSPVATTVTIDAGEFTVGIDGPVSQDYTRDDNDAVLANVTFLTGGEDIDIKDFYIAVQAQTSTGAGLSANNGSAGVATIAGVLEDVELRNKATGRTVDGVRLTTTSGTDYDSSATETFQIYRFDDFIVRGKQTWEFRVDFIDNGGTSHPKSGDKFRIHVCGEPTDILVNGSLTTNSTGCDFGGLITSSTSYQMQVEGLSTGDKVGDVRPRGNLAGNFQQITSATLTVVGKTLSSTETAVKNSKNVNLFRFEARSGEAEDILVTKFIFESAAGSLQNASNYTLWADDDGDGDVDTIIETGVASQSDQVSFNSLAGGGFIVPAEETVVFEVHGDLASNFVNSSLQIRFDTGSTAYIEAEELDDGSALSGIKTNTTCSSTCDIEVTTAFSTLFSLVNQGDLFVTKDSSPVRSRQLLGGTLTEEILRLQFHAENEPVDVTDIQITSSGSTAGSVDRLELYKDGASSPFALATIGGCGSDAKISTNENGGGTVQTFCANMESQQFVVPEGTDVDVLVRPRMKTDQQGATSNQIIALYLGSGTSASNKIIQARGAESSNDLTISDSDASAEGEIFLGRASAGLNAYIVGSPNVTVLSKITSITNGSSDPNGTAVPEGPNRAIGKFKITAAANSNSKDGLNDVVLSGVVFNITATNMTITDGTMKLYNEADSTVTATCDEYNPNNGAAISSLGSGSYVVECRALEVGAINTEVDQNTTSTFVLQANIASTQIGGNTSTLQVSLTNFESMTRTQFGTSSSASHLQWIDAEGAITSADPKFNWVEYPTTSVSSTTYVSG